MGVISPRPCCLARKKPALHQRLVQADCREIPFAHALVVCSFAVGHIFDLSVVREVSRVSAAGADVFVSDLHPLAYAQGWRTGFRDHQGAAEIATGPICAIVNCSWFTAEFKCVQSAECRLGEPERSIFAQTGKTLLFDEVCHIPAILILHFQRRLDTGLGQRSRRETMGRWGTIPATDEAVTAPSLQMPGFMGEELPQALLAISGVWLLFGSLSIWRCTWDDSYIGFRYAQDLGARVWALSSTRAKRWRVAQTSCGWCCLLALPNFPLTPSQPPSYSACCSTCQH